MERAARERNLLDAVAARIERGGNQDLDGELLPRVRAAQVVVETESGDGKAAAEQRKAAHAFLVDVPADVGLVEQESQEPHIERRDHADSPDAGNRAPVEPAGVVRLIEQAVRLRETAQIWRQQRRND